MNIVSYSIGYAFIMVNYLTIKQKEKEKVFFFLRMNKKKNLKTLVKQI